MKKGWELEDYENYVKVQLGGSILDLACKDDIRFIIEKIAFEDLKNYMQTTHTMTCAYSPTIDLKDKNVANVKYVLRNRNNNMTITGMDTNMFIYQTQGQYGMNQWAKDQITYNLLINQVRNTLSSDMDFNYDKVNEVLYLYCQHPIPSNITIAYVPEFKDVSEVYVPYWMSYLKRLSVAYTKETEGRIRSKYTLNSATYNLDGNTLLSEAQSELAQIRNELNENVNIMHTIN
jgi:hypothetical protein